MALWTISLQGGPLHGQERGADECPILREIVEDLREAKSNPGVYRVAPAISVGVEPANRVYAFWELDRTRVRGMRK